MITEKELQGAITECLTAKNPNANTCLKLAAYYIIQDHITQQFDKADGTSGISIPRTPETWAVMERLIDRLQIVNPNLYSITWKELNRVANRVAQPLQE